MITLRKMLFLIILIGLVTISCSTKEKIETSTKTDDNGITWYTNLEDAIRLAEKQERFIFVDFTGSDWCGWCFKLEEEVFSQTDFINFANENLIMLEIDFPRNIPQSEEVQSYNRNLLERFKVTGFPTILLLDKTGKEINRTGYQPGGAKSYVTHIKKLLRMI